MEHVLWIGGPPASGKTTVATRLARRHGLRLYSADTRTWDHRDRARRAGNAAAQRWESLSPTDRWERSTPQEMLEMSLHYERGPMVIDDLRSLPSSPLIVAEGSTLPAAALAAGGPDSARAVWLLPTAELQGARLDAMGTLGGQRRLYLLLREVIARDARAHELPTLTVDESTGASELLAMIESRFAGTLANGERAETASERRALLREMNDAVVAQIRGYFAQPWAEGDADPVERAFACECGEPGCEADVDLTVGAIAARRPFAPGHEPRSGSRMIT